MPPVVEEPRPYRVNASDREPLLAFITDALERAGCRVISRPRADVAPFRFTFETPTGERLGLIAYAFFANTAVTRNRPSDEHRFQVKYGGSDDGTVHELWQDPLGMYVTLLVGINPEEGFFVGADPVLHSPTRFFKSIEFKQDHVDRILKTGWHAWGRASRPRLPPRTGEALVGEEVLVGGTADNFLRYVKFEREALGEDAGHRQLLAERMAGPAPTLVTAPSVLRSPTPAELHTLALDFAMSEKAVLDLIRETPRVKMAVRGAVAEAHLVRVLSSVPGVTECSRPNEEGGPDVRLRFEGSKPITLECKNVLRQRMANGQVKVDFQRTRASKFDPCSRYYSPHDFDVVAACLHAVEERWIFKYCPSVVLDRYGPKCPEKLSNNVRLDDRWKRPIQDVLREVVNG